MMSSDGWSFSLAVCKNGTNVDLQGFVQLQLPNADGGGVPLTYWKSMKKLRIASVAPLQEKELVVPCGCAMKGPMDRKGKPLLRPVVRVIRTQILLLTDLTGLYVSDTI